MNKLNDIKIAVSISPEKSKFSPLLFAGDIYKGISTASELGYDGVEISIRDSDLINKQEIISLFEKFNIKALSIATGQSYFTDGYCFSSPDKENREYALKRMKGHADFASILNCGLVVGGILGNVREKFGKASDIEKRIIDSFYKFAEYAKQKSVKIFFEPINLYLTYFICTLDEGAEFIKTFGSFNNIELLPDTHHMHMEEKSAVKSLKKHIKLINYIHFSDSNRQAPGFGNIDFTNIVITLKKEKFKGIISFEILPVPDDYKAAMQAINHTKKLIQNIRA